MNPTITSIQLCVGHRDPMKKVTNAQVKERFGIEGDRHATSTGVRQARQVLLMDQKTLTSFGLIPGQIRENITTDGIELHSLAEGQHIILGSDVVLRITGHCAPCARMDEISPGLQERLEKQRGMLATVIQGGTIRIGDEINLVDSTEDGFTCRLT